VHIIFNTDIGANCDDIGALTILPVLADNDEAKILGVICSSGAPPYTVDTVDVINTDDGRPNIPVGAEQSDFGYSSPQCATQVDAETTTYGHDSVVSTDVPAALTVYCELLADAPDHSVTLVAVGQPKARNDRLLSSTDDASSLNGMELVQLKLQEWVAMGGVYPSGSEYNFDDMSSGPKPPDIIENGRVKATFSGTKIGNATQTGSGLAELPKNNPSPSIIRSLHTLFWKKLPLQPLQLGSKRSALCCAWPIKLLDRTYTVFNPNDANGLFEQ
jgi:hypothetical protein